MASALDNLTYPGDRYQETSCGSDEEGRANPINAFQLLSQFRRLEIQLEKQRNEDKGDANKWQVDPEDPSLLVH